MPTGSISREHFAKCHHGVIAILDALRGRGAEVNVRDGSGYWEHRDNAEPARRLNEWNEIVAAVIGAIKDIAAGRRLRWRGKCRCADPQRSGFRAPGGQGTRGHSAKASRTSRRRGDKGFVTLTGATLDPWWSPQVPGIAAPRRWTESLGLLNLWHECKP